jgi:hypothetical protein
MGRACCTNGKKRKAYRVLVRKPERKRPLGRFRHRWVLRTQLNGVSYLVS